MSASQSLAKYLLLTSGLGIGAFFYITSEKHQNSLKVRYSQGPKCDRELDKKNQAILNHVRTASQSNVNYAWALSYGQHKTDKKVKEVKKQEQEIQRLERELNITNKENKKK